MYVLSSAETACIGCLYPPKMCTSSPQKERAYYILREQNKLTKVLVSFGDCSLIIDIALNQNVLQDVVKGIKISDIGDIRSIL